LSSHLENGAQHKVTGYFPSVTGFSKAPKNDKADTNLEYDLDTNNCTDRVMDMAGLAGVILPDATGKWRGGGEGSPGPLGQELASQPGSTVLSQSQSQGGDSSKKTMCLDGYCYRSN